MQEFKPMVVLVSVDDQFVINRHDLRRIILAYAVKMDLHATQFEFQQRRHAFYALDHAGRYGSEEQLGGIEGIRSAADIGIENDLGVLCCGEAAVGINQAGL